MAAPSENKAVIPVAIGNQMPPATKAILKEMLPLVDKPLIQYVVNEWSLLVLLKSCCYALRLKTLLKTTFDTRFELEAMLENALSVSFWRRCLSSICLRMSTIQVRHGLAKARPCRIVRASRCRKRTCRCYSRQTLF